MRHLFVAWASLCVASCYNGATFGEFPTSGSLEQAIVLPTDPLFGPHGIFQMERDAGGSSDGGAADDANQTTGEGDPPAANCAALQPLLERLRLGLQDTKEFRTLIKTTAWGQIAAALQGMSSGECAQALLEGDDQVDCAGLQEQVSSGWANLQTLAIMQQVQSMGEWRDLRRVYWAYTDGGCSGGGDGSGGETPSSP